MSIKVAAPRIRLIHGGSIYSQYDINFDPAGPYASVPGIASQLRQLKPGDKLMMTEVINPNNPCECMCHMAMYVVGCRAQDCESLPDIHQVALPLAEPLAIDWPMPEMDDDDHCPPTTGGDNTIYLDKLVDIADEDENVMVKNKVLDIA